MHIDFNEVINQMLVMVLIIAVGFLARKLKVLTKEGNSTLSGLVINITSPALIISSMSLPTDKNIAKNILIVSILALCAISFMYILSGVLKHVKGISKDEYIIYRFCTVFGNASFLGFPLCYGLFGDIGLLYASIYSAVQDTFFWSLGVRIMADNTKKKGLKNLINPCMIAIVIGITILFSGITLPVFIIKTFSTVGSATLPLALILVGSGFYNSTYSLKGFKKDSLPTLIKLVILPTIAAIILFFINIDMIIKYVLLIEISMPCAASTVVLAENYKRDYTLASRMVMMMTAFGIVTIPVLILIFEKFI